MNIADDLSVQNQQWTFRLTATSTESTKSSNNLVTYDFTVNLLDGCLLDTISNPSTIDNFDYYVGASGVLPVSAPTFT